jgi:hypothetical protein
VTAPTVQGQVIDDPVGDLAQHVLDTIVATYEAAVATPDTQVLRLPKRQEIVVGAMTVEGEHGQLGVMFGGCHVGPPGNEMSSPFRGDQPRSAIFNIELWRAVSTGRGGATTARAPKASKVTEQAKIAMLDAWILLQAAFACDYVGGPGVIASTSPLPPEGGLQGIQLSLTLQVP